MKLTFDQIRSITKGATYVTEENGAVRFHRFNETQEELYKERSADCYKKAFATAGVRLEFTTDSPSLSLEVAVRSGASRHYFSHDISVNGALVSSFGSIATTNGIFAHTCELGEGMKTVAVYFPWSACSTLRGMELADGSTLSPVTKQYKMLVYGDSITQGYDAALTSQSYANRLADLLGAEAINRGIGGEQFFPALGETSGELEPDLITVAYGTNDWSKAESYATYEEHCRGFYGALSHLYPKAKIFAVTPIWRKDSDLIKAVGTFDCADKIIRGVAATLPNVTVIDGYDFVPHDPSYFWDLRLHPNDAGFEHYANNLYEEIKKYL